MNYINYGFYVIIKTLKIGFEKLKLELSHLSDNKIKDSDDEEFEKMILNEKLTVKV